MPHPVETFYTVSPPQLLTINPPFLPNTIKSLTPLHGRYLFTASNYNHLNSDETNQTNNLVERVEKVATLY